MPSANITMHAIERYVDRIDRGASIHSARAQIRLGMESATRQKVNTGSGDAIYLAQDGMRFVVAEEGNSLTVITVLEACRCEQESAMPPLALELDQQYREFMEKRGRQILARPTIEQTTPTHTKPSKLQALQLQILERDNTITRLRAIITQKEGYVSRERYERQVAHGKRMESERNELKHLLKRVVSALVGSSPNAELLGWIEKEHPELVEYVRTNDTPADV